MDQIHMDKARKLNCKLIVEVNCQIEDLLGLDFDQCNEKLLQNHYKNTRSGSVLSDRYIFGLAWMDTTSVWIKEFEFWEIENGGVG